MLLRSIVLRFSKIDKVRKLVQILLKSDQSWYFQFCSIMILCQKLNLKKIHSSSVMYNVTSVRWQLCLSTTSSFLVCVIPFNRLSFLLPPFRLYIRKNSLYRIIDVYSQSLHLLILIYPPHRSFSPHYLSKLSRSDCKYVFLFFKTLALLKFPVHCILSIYLLSHICSSLFLTGN